MWGIFCYASVLLEGGGCFAELSAVCAHVGDKD